MGVPVMGYGSVCNGRELAALVETGWGILFAPYALENFGPQRRRFMKDPPAPYCIDNGAWSQKGGDVFDPFRFMQLVGLLGRGAEFVVLPDIVAGGHRSLDRSKGWLRALEPVCRQVLIPVQNGLTPADLMPFLGPKVGVFLGGTDSYKLRTMATWGQATQEAACYYHVGRVNSAKRIGLCGAAWADSFDGSGVSVYGCVPHSSSYLPRLEAARTRAVELRDGRPDPRQGAMFGGTP